jgi:tetratricopeptide (TPR) repeat protein
LLALQRLSGRKKSIKPSYKTLIMKSLKFVTTSLFLAFAILFAGCGGLGKMEKYIEELGAKAEPDPLIVRGDSIELTVTGTFPAKYFHKKVVAEATPVLTFEGGEQAFKMKGYQGESAAGNYEVIPYEKGKSFSYSSSIAYTPSMDESNLELRIKGTKGSKSAEFDPLPIGKGVITTAYLIKSDDKALMAKDNFKRILSFEKNAVINFDYNSSNVKAAELKDADIKELAAFILSTTKGDSISIKGIDVQSYCSPEGEISLNENLAQERSESANAVVAAEFKKNKINIENPEAFFKNTPKGEDWAGFKEKMEKSNIQDKNLILRVLEMYTDLNKREQEIKNLAATYKEIQDEILPQLRRSQIYISYDLVGYSDEEITQLASSNPSILTVEEILYAATLTEDLNEKLRIYKEAEKNYPNDWRGINNVGYIYMLQNKTNDAEAQFNKAFEVKADPIVANNLGIIARLKGDRDKALDYFADGAAAGAEVKYNKGLVQIQNGDYPSAISGMGTYNTFNLALAKTLNGDASGAKTVMSNSGDDSATADYLRAIIAARLGDGTGVSTNLASAVSKDGSLKAKAMKDLEFRNYWDSLNL